MEKVDVIIPAYRPREEFAGLLDALCSQELSHRKYHCHEYRRKILESQMGGCFSKSESDPSEKRTL